MWTDGWSHCSSRNWLELDDYKQYRISFFSFVRLWWIKTQLLLFFLDTFYSYSFIVSNAHQDVSTIFSEYCIRQKHWIIWVLNWKCRRVETCVSRLTDCCELSNMILLSLLIRSDSHRIWWDIGDQSKYDATWNDSVWSSTFFFTCFITSGWVKFRFSCLSVCLYFINLLLVNSVFSEHFILIIRIEMSYSFHKTFSVWNSSLLFILSMNLDVYTFFFYDLVLIFYFLSKLMDF